MSRGPRHLPLSAYATALEAAFLLHEAASVWALRAAALSGLRPLAPGEALRMIAEKPPAFAASAHAALDAALRGRRAEEVMAAALRPLRLEARANAQRLSRIP
ncbi:MAG: hypothetical protein V2I65_08990 [Paracoccaceae bacterium]|nr:hypothetical protein [Paracoccaceae bacterium]